MKMQKTQRDAEGTRREDRGHELAQRKDWLPPCASVPSVVDGKPDYLTASTVFSVPFLTPCPTPLTPFSAPLAVSLAATLVAWPVLSAAFSVPFAVSFAASLVA